MHYLTKKDVFTPSKEIPLPALCAKGEKGKNRHAKMFVFFYD